MKNIANLKPSKTSYDENLETKNAVAKTESDEDDDTKAKAKLASDSDDNSSYWSAKDSID